MSENESLASCRKVFGDTATVERKVFVLPTPGVGIEMFYCWLEGSIKAVGGSREELVENAAKSVSLSN